MKKQVTIILLIAALCLSLTVISFAAADCETLGLEHDPVEIPAVEASCSGPGLSAGVKCSVCGKILTPQVETALALEHSYVDIVIEPSCEDRGFTLHSCSVCGANYKDNYQPALGHDRQLEHAKSATCTEPGYTGDEVCTRCGDTVSGELIPSFGHSFGVWSTITPATCTETGLQIHTCSRCGTSEEQIIPTAGHSTVLVNDKRATCTEPGYYGDRVCTVCGATVQLGQVIPAIGHSGVQLPGKEPTCTETGLTEGLYCYICGETIVPQEIIPATEHSFVDEVTEASCGQAGYTDHRCSVCGYRFIDEIIDPLEHDYEETVTPPSCIAMGYTTRVCKNCGDTSEGDYVDALGHDWNEGVVTTPASETTKGIMTYTCTRCGGMKIETIPETGGGDVELPFTDVVADSYYEQPVKWAYANEITGGTDGTHFSPNDVCTRAHVVTFLWRAAGKPQPISTENPFTDVQPGAYYYEAVLWAVENGITTGYSDGSFRPGNACTRAHVVTFLWRYEQKPDPISAVFLSDLDELVPDFKSAITWASSIGVTTGYNDGTFRPDVVCTRAHVVSFLYRDLVQARQATAA